MFRDEERHPIMLPVRPRLTAWQKALYGLGHVFNDLCAAMWFSYTLFFLQIVLEVEAGVAGSLIMIGTILVGLSFPLLFSICPLCDMSESWKLAYFILVILIFQIGWAIVQISHLSIIPAISDSNGDRTELTAIRYIASVMASVAVYVITYLVLNTDVVSQDKIGPKDSFKFREISLVVVLIGILASGAFHCGMYYNRNCAVLKHSSVTSNDTTKKTKALLDFLLAVPIYQVSLLYVSSRLFVTLNMIYMPLYLEEKMMNFSSGNADPTNLRDSVASVPLVSFLASFLTTFLLKQKSICCNNKMEYFLGSIVSLLGCLWIGLFITDFNMRIMIYIVAILIGAGSSTTMVSSLCLTAELIGPDTEKGASVYSVVTFADKLISGLAVVIIEHIKCDDRQDCPNYYEHVMTFVSGGTALLGLLTLITVNLSRP